MRCCFFFFFKQKTAYEMRISDWSSDVCSSDLFVINGVARELAQPNTWSNQQMAKRRRGHPQQRNVTIHMTKIPPNRRKTAYRSLRKIAEKLGAPFVIRRLSKPYTEDGRSEERGEGKECVSTGRSRWRPYH